MTQSATVGPGDHDEIVELSLRAWAPVFASVGEVLETLLHGTHWREHQARDVRAAEHAAKRAWVAEEANRSVGFAVATVADDARLIGEIHMVAVDPGAQRHGSLTEHAAACLREQAMRVARNGTGGDLGHAPARRLYERLGYRLPSTQFFRVLDPSLVVMTLS